MTEQQDPRIGTIVTKYQIIKPLGKGGMGAVFLGEHRLMGKVAVKFLDIGGYRNFPTLMKRFEAEAKALGALRGTPNIAAILDVTEEEPFVIITEYVEGSPFSEILENEGLWNKAAQVRYLDVLVKISAALAVAHKLGIIHRDAKPDNIICYLLEKGVLDPRLIDFGISRMAPEEGSQRLTTFESIMGSLMWAAPEQLLTPLEIDQTVDIYSLGLMLFLIFNRGVHFYGTDVRLDPAAPVKAILNIKDLVENEARTRRLLKALDPRVAEIIWPCLRFKPQDRVQSMEEVHQSLLKLHQELSKELKATSMAMTAEVPVMDEADLDPKPDQEVKRRAHYSETVHGWSTDHGVESPPEDTGQTVKDLAPPAFVSGIQESAPPSTAEDFRASEATEPINPDTPSRWKLWLLVGTCAAAVLATIAIFGFNNTKKASPKKHAKALHTKQKVKDSKPQVMKKVVKPQPPAMKNPQPVMKVTSRPVAKKPEDPCKHKKGEASSMKCIAHHCKRKKGEKPSDRCIELYYEKQVILCKRSDQHRDKFEKYPFFLLSCLKRHAWKIRSKNVENFDRVLFAALFMDEIRTHFCFRERLWICSGPEMKYRSPRGLLKKGCKRASHSIFGRGQRSLLYFMDGPKATRIKDWILARKKRKKRFQVRWIKSQSPHEMACFNR